MTYNGMFSSVNELYFSSLNFYSDLIRMSVLFILLYLCINDVLTQTGAQ